MGWLNQNIPNPWQWVGLFATVAGTLLSLWAVVSAKGARKQAELAKMAAIRLGCVTQLTDLIGEMQELQAMLMRKDFEGVAMKCGHLRGRVVRFKTESYNELNDDEAANLDLCREQLEIIGRVAAVGKGLDSNRLGKIQIAYGNAQEAVNRVLALRRTDAEETKDVH